jgi:hypothetical protein
MHLPLASFCLALRRCGDTPELDLTPEVTAHVHNQASTRIVDPMAVMTLTRPTGQIILYNFHVHDFTIIHVKLLWAALGCINVLAIKLQNATLLSRCPMLAHSMSFELLQELLKVAVLFLPYLHRPMLALDFEHQPTRVCLPALRLCLPQCSLPLFSQLLLCDVLYIRLQLCTVQDRVVQANLAFCSRRALSAHPSRQFVISWGTAGALSYDPW